MIKLSQLAIYPIKSTAQIPLTTATTGLFGLENDRRWMLIDARAQMLTQRKHARMCLIQSSIQQASLTVSAPGMPDLSIPLNTPRPETNSPAHTQIQATVWEDTCNADDCGQQAADWFSEFLSCPARLVRFADAEKRQVDLNFARPGDITAFSDGFPYLLISQASLDDLNSHLSTPVNMDRFRPNIVISGTDPFAEDHWKKIRIGNIEFSIVKPCSRCIIPSIDPGSAEKTVEPLKTLASYRQRDNKIFFGQNVIARKVSPADSAILEVGMDVIILE
ncbi:Flavodoxin reductases (ferredoxin-NADPH reductases) family 1 [hydrothermal vent metagenome]|uniref:Flavodoxin reductases (Ferredoxin-NADPH reductases) family 1 n=1 Tax=hydrothermal vent metagenome TaxID=652676 RepID=A0A3B0X561_9ZZZZ